MERECSKFKPPASNAEFSRELSNIHSNSPISIFRPGTVLERELPTELTGKLSDIASRLIKPLWWAILIPSEVTMGIFPLSEGINSKPWMDPVSIWLIPANNSIDAAFSSDKSNTTSRFIDFEFGAKLNALVVSLFLNPTVNSKLELYPLGKLRLLTSHLPEL